MSRCLLIAGHESTGAMSPRSALVLLERHPTHLTQQLEADPFCLWPAAVDERCVLLDDPQVLVGGVATERSRSAADDPLPGDGLRAL